MWFAALGQKINNEPFLTSLVVKLFSESPSVLSLLSKNPFKKKAPKYLKIDKLKLKFTDWNHAVKSGKKVLKYLPRPSRWWSV